MAACGFTGELHVAGRAACHPGALGGADGCWRVPRKKQCAEASFDFWMRGGEIGFRVGSWRGGLAPMPCSAAQRRKFRRNFLRPPPPPPPPPRTSVAMGPPPAESMTHQITIGEKNINISGGFSTFFSLCSPSQRCPERVPREDTGCPTLFWWGPCHFLRVLSFAATCASGIWPPRESCMGRLPPAHPQSRRSQAQRIWREGLR